MHAASAELRFREYEAEAASAMGYPEVGLNAKEVGGHKTMDLGTFPVLGKIKKEVELGGPRSSITMNWPIYTGGRITAAQEAKAADTDVARAEQRETAERLDSELVRRYFGLRLAEDVERLRLAQFEQANRDFERALQFEKQGQLSALARRSRARIHQGGPRAISCRSRTCQTAA
jgi:outer membrane protein TolC